MISVIIPVYNSSKTIIECIESVVNELTCNPYKWELILVDDGSTDDSVKIIQQYISVSEFKVNINLIQQKNAGAAVARNTGLRIARGKFIAFNDSDDRWIMGKISKQINYFMSHSKIDMVAGFYGNDKLNTLPIKRINYATPITIKNQVLKNYFCPPTVIIRKTILEKTGLFNEKMRYAEEGYFFNRMVVYGVCVILNEKVAEPIIKKKRWGDSGLSANLNEMEKGELFNITEAYRSKFIGLGLYLFAINFSITKYIRRVIIKKLRTIKFNGR